MLFRSCHGIRRHLHNVGTADELGVHTSAANDNDMLHVTSTKEWEKGLDGMNHSERIDFVLFV